MRSLVSVIFFRMLRTTFYATFALTFCVWIIQSSKFLSMLNTRHISLEKFFHLTAYLSVDIVSVVLPIALSISAAFVYQRLAESNQLIALQSSGISPKKILSPLLLLSLICSGYLYVCNFYISPIAWQSFRDLEFKITNNIAPPQNAGVIFSGANISVYAQHYSGDVRFKNIFIIDLRAKEKHCSYFAKTGIIKDNILYLRNGERIEIETNNNNKSSVMKFDTYSYDLHHLFNTHARTKNPNEKSATELLNDYTSEEQKISQAGLFHQKMTSPLSAIILSFLAFSLVVLAPYSRKKTYRRIAILITLVILFQGTFFWLANACAKSSNLVVPFYVFSLLSLLVSIILTMRGPATK